MRLSAVLRQLATLVVLPPDPAPTSTPTSTPTPTDKPAPAVAPATSSASAQASPPTTDATSPQSLSPPHPPAAPQTPSGVKVADILALTSHAGFGFAITLLSLAAVPFVGLSVPFGIATTLLGLQMIAGRHQPCLPRAIRERELSMKTLNWVTTKLALWVTRMERFVKPRLLAATRPPFFTAIGIGVFIQAFGLALPLPIPGSNWFFIVPLLIYAIGLMEEDGLFILFAHVLTLVQIALCIIFWTLIRDTLVDILNWLWRLI